MTAPAKLNYKLYQGSTFSEVLRWETATKVYKPISNILKAAPMTVTAPAHGVPVGWRTRITNVTGMKELLSFDYLVPTEVTEDTLTFNAVNSLGYTNYVSGAVLEYNQPVDLTGYTARMQIREKLDSSIVLHELSTELGTIVLDNTTKSITMNILPATSAVLNFNTAVYSLEMVSSGGQVTQLIAGTFTLIKEVTR